MCNFGIVTFNDVALTCSLGTEALSTLTCPLTENENWLGGFLMSIIDSLKEVITQKPVHLKKPLFYKSDSDAERQLKSLKELLERVPAHVKGDVEKDINLLTYGIVGEKNVAFELNNSFLPMIVLHDLCLMYEELSAQIDYLIITPKVNLVVECKNLVGDIEVNASGDFIRTIKYGGRYHKEGIYSPITQNRRHLEVIKAARKQKKGNFFTQALFEKFFDDNYKSVVVLSNPKTVINMRYAKKEVKEQIIRSDQLIEYIKKLMNESSNPTSTEKEMYEIADAFLEMHTSREMDYTKKYGMELNLKVAENLGDQPVIPARAGEKTNIEETSIYKALKQYRLETSKKEGIKAYYIYNNAQMEELIEMAPTTLEDIKKVSGFGEMKCRKYGEDILEIFRAH